MVHVASSLRSRGIEAEDGQSNGVGCDIMEVGQKIPFISYNFLFST
jgi:hypothetical protein